MSLNLKRKGSELPGVDVKKPKGNGSITSFFGAPKTVLSTAKANGNSNGPSSSPVSSTWDKEAWVKKLSGEQKQLLALEIGTLHESWLKELKDEITSESFLELKRFLKTEAQSGKKIYPPSEDVYSWSVSLLYSAPFFGPADNNYEKVSTYTPQHCQSGDHRPGPLPQCQPGARLVLLRPPAHDSPSLSEEHLHLSEERLPDLPTPTQQLRPAHALGGPWRAAPQHRPDCPRARCELARRQGMGEVHAEGYRYCGREAHQRRRVSGVGQAGGAEGQGCESGEALRAPVRASESVERVEGVFPMRALQEDE